MKLDLGFLKIRRRCLARALAEEGAPGIRGRDGIKAAETAEGCSGKERYDDYGQATRIVMRRSGKKHDNRQAYSCKSCGGWHIGSHL